MDYKFINFFILILALSKFEVKVEQIDLLSNFGEGLWD